MEPFDENVPQTAPELNTQLPDPAAAPQEVPSAESPAASAEVPVQQEQPAEASAQQPESEKAAAEQPAKEKKDGGFLGDLMDLLESVIVSIFVVMLVFTFLFCTADVDGTSMVPTLADRDRLLVNRIDKDYERGDILIIDSDKARLLDESGNIYEQEGLKKRIVKRLIAKGGQQIDIDFSQGIVYVDGEALTEPYINNLTTRDNCAFTYPLTVPEGYIYVLGDNRAVSRDSRDEKVGLIPEENIVGKVILRISPFSSFGKVQ